MQKNKIRFFSCLIHIVNHLFFPPNFQSFCTSKNTQTLRRHDKKLQRNIWISRAILLTLQRKVKDRNPQFQTNNHANNERSYKDHHGKKELQIFRS